MVVLRHAWLHVASIARRRHHLVNDSARCADELSAGVALRPQ
jgi:hypothetical protein